MLRQLHASKPQSLVTGYCSRMLTLTSALNYWSCSNSHKKIHLWGRRKRSKSLCGKHLLKNDRVVDISCGIYLKNSLRDYGMISARRFTTSNPQVVDEEVTDKNLPWLATYKAKDERNVDKVFATKPKRSSWGESADKFLKGGGARDRGKRMDGRPVDSTGKDEGIEEKEEEEGNDEPIDDPRWDKIKTRFDRVVDLKPGFERLEFKRWNKQENWGRKTFKDATESTLPKMVGVGVYGVGPVLAALSAGRREFYTLYLQEGLVLGGNIRKKKDKKGFEKVLKMASKIELSTKEVSKHDLNMITDNRPHQGLVLDASPLELVGIKELEPVSEAGEEYGYAPPLWVALDEVTDPQNLGAIIRSSYFFGASGVVLCAKNSAPLSGVVSKASAGSLEVMELRSCKNMMQFLTSSARNGWRVLGGSVTPTAVPLNQIVPGVPTILVLGSEGTGLRPLVERSCTQLIKIPGNAPVSVVVVPGEEDENENEERSGADLGIPVQEFNSFLAVESLNVSVAAGVLLHHLVGNTGSSQP